MKKQIMYKTNKRVYYKITRVRTIYYKARVSGKRFCEPVTIRKEKFDTEIKRLKRLNNKSN